VRGRRDGQRHDHRAALTALVNCASVTRTGAADSFTDDEWLEAFQVKAFGAHAGTPDDVAGVVAFLLSPDGEWGL
jgi:NAD(P)-dependent dehydrogenase (short-subunit alcohol dehydrogenase family)